MQKDLRGTWRQALISFLSPLLFILCLRWLIVEPFVIPSGSMIPNLLVHDYILVKKISFGVKTPFFDKWLWMWKEPTRGQIIVFKYPVDPDLHFVKRLIGLPGDHIKFENQMLFVNGKQIETKDFQGLLPARDYLKDLKNFDYFVENNNTEYVIRYSKNQIKNESTLELVVPADKYFFMGDNRDQSSDSRVWGFVDKKYIVGQVWMIWMSCDRTLESMSYICDPATLRWNRMFRGIGE